MHITRSVLVSCWNKAKSICARLCNLKLRHPGNGRLPAAKLRSISNVWLPDLPGCGRGQDPGQHLQRNLSQED
eukprot:12936268-Prorocentrum_lima.AAC.1